MISNDLSAETVAQTLELSAELLERNGWCKGAMDSGSRRCAYGALAETLKQDNVLSNANKPCVLFYAVQAVINYLHTEGELTGLKSEPNGADLSLLDSTKVKLSWLNSRALVAWNDVPERRVEDVTSVMRKSALVLREKVAE